MSALAKNDKKFYIVLIITLAIMVGFGFLPTFGQVTRDGMKILGIFLGCIFAWIFGEVMWSSLLGIILLIFYNYGTMNDLYPNAYGNTTIAIMVTSIVFCYAVEKSGLLAEISRWIVGQKWAQKGPMYLIFAFLLATLVATLMIGSMLPVIILMWALFYELAHEIGVKKNAPFVVVTLCGVGVMSCVGANIMPYTAMPIIVRGMALAVDPEFVYNYGQYILLNVVYALALLVLLVVVSKLFFGKSLKNLEIPKREPYKIKLNIEKKIVLAFLFIMILSMIIPNFLSADNPVRSLVNDRLTIAGIFMLIAVILSVIRINGKPILDIGAAISSIPWSLFLLVSTALCVSNFLTMDEMGIIPTIVSAINPLFSGKSAFVITMIFIVIGVVMTNFINDMVTIMVLFPIAAQFVAGAGGDIMLLAILFGQAAAQGCLMPSGSVVGAMLHGNTEWLKSADVFKCVGIMECAVIVAFIVTVFVGRLFGI